MPEVWNGAVRISYDAAGNGPALILIHGYRDTAVAWRHQISAFSDQWRVITPDLRGHGRSDVPADDDYSYPTLARDILAILDAEGLDRPIIAGHSLGGMILSELVANHPSRVAAAIFSSTSPLPSDAGRRDTLSEQIGIIERYGMEALAQLTPRWRRAPGESEDDLRLAVETVRTMSPQAAIGYARLMRDQPGWEASLHDSPVQALVVRGTADSANIQNGSAALLHLLPNATEAAIQGAGHYVQHTHPMEYNRALAAFLSAADTI